MSEIVLRLPKLYAKQYAAMFDAHRYSIVEASTKSGKTVGCICWLLAKAWEGGKDGRNFWWVAPIYPQAKIAFRRMCRMLSRTDPKKTLWDANESELFIRLKVNGSFIWFKGADNTDSLYAEDVYAAVIDESTRCFMAGTPVETPNGFCPIESLSVGDAVKNAAGIGFVRGKTRTVHNKIAVVKVQGYTMVSSCDHRYFTQRGWVEAMHLEQTDTLIEQRQAVRILRKNIRAVEREGVAVLQPPMLVQGNKGTHRNASMCVVSAAVYGACSGEADHAFLRAELLREMANVAVTDTREGFQSRDAGEIKSGAAEVLGERFGGSECPQEVAPTTQRHAGRIGSRQSGSHLAENRTQASRAGRKWFGPHLSPANIAGNARRYFQGRVLCDDRRGTEEGRPAAALLDRFSRTIPQDCGGGGRGFAPFAGTQRSRREEGCVLSRAGVDSVQVLESGDFRFREYSGGKDTICLYDIEVSGHPSFSVNGFLVHNCKDEAWHAIRSTITKTRGPVRIIGNVKGRKNWAYNLGQKARAGDPNMAYHKLTAWDAVEGGVLDAEEVESAKRELPDAVFRELYLAEPSDNGANPFGLAAIKTCVGDLSTLPAAVYGVDLAKSHDWCVLVGLDVNGAVCRLERWQGDWRSTRTRLIGTIGDTPALVDSTGVGDPILEDLQSALPAVEGFKFSSPSKQQLMEGLAAAIQQEGIKYPAGWLVDELESFEFEHTRTGVRYSAPEGLHDDGVCALALARRCATTHVSSFEFSLGGADSGASAAVDWMDDASWRAA